MASLPPSSWIPHPNLETLPAELRAYILFYVLDVGALRAVVHASPVLHQQYLLNRQHLLGQALEATLGSVLVDAYIHALSSTVPVKRQNKAQLGEEGAVADILDEYRELHEHSRPNLAVLERCDIRDLAAMVSFYLTVIQPLLGRATLLLRNLQEPPKHGLVEELSTTERTRLLRALYRFQIFQDLYGYQQPAWPPFFRRGRLEVLGGFFGLFEPWEAEEVQCVNHVVRSRYDRVLDDVRWEAYREDPDLLGFLRSTVASDPENLREALLEGTVARGLKLFNKVLTTPNREESVKLVEENMTVTLGHTILQIFQWAIHEFGPRPHQLNNDDDVEESAGQEPLFPGDKEDGPPLGWLISWGRTCTNFPNRAVPSALRTWGFVFWDAERVLRTGGKREVLRTWAPPRRR